MYDFFILDQRFEVWAGLVHFSLKEQNEMLIKVGFKDIK
jgi:hypothetical protein